MNNRREHSCKGSFDIPWWMHILPLSLIELISANFYFLFSVKSAMYRFPVPFKQEIESSTLSPIIVEPNSLIVMQWILILDEDLFLLDTRQNLITMIRIIVAKLHYKVINVISITIDIVKEWKTNEMADW